MRTVVVVAAIVFTSLAHTASAGTPQPVVVTPAGTSLNANILYEIDYATAGKYSAGNVNGVVDTIVSIGFPAVIKPSKCNVQVVWYDWNGALAGISGNYSLSAGVTLEFTTSINSGNPAEYPPYMENIFSNITAPFEGYAQIRVDSSCASAKLRVDAEFVTHVFPVSGTNIGEGFSAKPINVTSPKGVSGY